MDTGEIRIGSKRFRPDLAKHQIKDKIGKCLSTTSYVLVAGCVILFILGVALFGVGVSSLVSEKAIHALHIPGITSLPAWMTAIGLFLCVLSVVGGIGSFYYRPSFLIAFGSVLTLILFFEFTLGIIAATRADDFSSLASKAWDSSSNKTRISLETQFSCCGFFNTTDRAVAEGCPDGKYGSADVRDACDYAITKYIKGFTVQIAVAAFVITFFEGVTAVITCLLAHKIKLAYKYSAVNQDAFDEYSFSDDDGGGHGNGSDSDSDDDVEFLKNDPDSLLE